MEVEAEAEAERQGRLERMLAAGDVADDDDDDASEPEPEEDVDDGAAGPDPGELRGGELFKLERAMLTGKTEYHRRHFVLQANQLQYFRLLHTVTGEWTMGQQAQAFLLSEIDTARLCSPEPPPDAAADSNIDVSFSDSGTLGLTIEWPTGLVTAIEPGSPGSRVEGLAPGHEVAAINGTETLEMSKSAATALFHSAPRPTRLLFKPAAERLRFEITMNRNYRKPGRVYRMQAPTRASCVAWVEAIRQAKASFDELGPWQTRGLTAQSTTEHVSECMVSRARQVQASSMFGRPYTVFVIEARTRGGVSFQCEKRFSDFRAFHAEWLEPVMSLGSPLPIPSANPVDKNSEETVESRKRGLTEYLREAVALCDRLGSPAVTAALQRFLQPGDGGGGSSTPREDSDLVPRSELWRQVQGTVWDATGTWAFKETASVNGADALLEHRLVLGADGEAVFEASGHPSTRKAVRGTGKWQNVDNGRQIEASLTFATEPPADLRMTLRKEVRGPSEPAVDGVEWTTRVHDQRRLLVRTQSSIGGTQLLEGQPGHDPALGAYQVPHAWGSRAEAALE